MEDLPGAMPMDQQRSLLQTAVLTQFKYIKDDVHRAKDPSLNKNLSLCREDQMCYLNWLL